MLKHLSALLLCVCSLFLAACSIPSNPPATVTDPALRSLYMNAVAGDGAALYSVSRMYGAGSNGFPKSSWYASIALSDAAANNHPQAVYELAVSNLHSVRDNLTSYHARNDSYKDWAELEDDIISVRREVARAGSLGDARAANTLAAIDEDLVRYRQLTQQERWNYVRCRRCNGEGMAWQRERDDCERKYKRCKRCDGKGFVRRWCGWLKNGARSARNLITCAKGALS